MMTVYIERYKSELKVFVGLVTVYGSIFFSKGKLSAVAGDLFYGDKTEYFNSKSDSNWYHPKLSCCFVSQKKLIYLELLSPKSFGNSFVKKPKTKNL
jgi:hypothetical protein